MKRMRWIKEKVVCRFVCLVEVPLKLAKKCFISYKNSYQNLIVSICSTTNKDLTYASIDMTYRLVYSLYASIDMTYLSFTYWFWKNRTRISYVSCLIFSKILRSMYLYMHLSMYPVMFYTLRKFWKMFHTLDTSTPGRRLKNKQQLNMLPGIHFLDHSKIIKIDFFMAYYRLNFRIWEISACETFFHRNFYEIFVCSSLL